MAYEAKIITDSIDPTGDRRLLTYELTYPRFVHAEFMTHRLFSRNAASSRAIPISKMIGSVIEDPAMPVWWGRNQKGMQAAEELSEQERRHAVQDWLNARDNAVQSVRSMQLIGETGVHKQIANRLLEPWCWITVVCTATDYGNFFAQRCHKDAQPEIQKIAYMMRDLYYSSTPTSLGYNEWHMPYIKDGDAEDLVAGGYDLKSLMLVSVARCARVSYLTQSGVRDVKEDVTLFTRLTENGHWSPLEHVAKPYIGATTSNFTGWHQLRKGFANEFRSYTQPTEG